MSIFGSDSIKIKFTLDSVDYTKTLTKTDYFYDNKLNKKILKIRRDIRDGSRKQVFKGNEKQFTYTMYDVTKSEWEDFYSKLKTLNNIDYYPHNDLDYPYEVYCEKIEFRTVDNISAVGVIDFVFNSNNYKDTRIPEWVLETGIWDSNGVWLENGIWNSGV